MRLLSGIIDEMARWDWTHFQDFVGDLAQECEMILLERGGVGPDGGRDHIVKIRQRVPRLFEERWVIQAKHVSDPKKSLSAKDLDSIGNTCALHRAKGLLLVTNGQVTDVLSRQIAIHDGVGTSYKAAFWNGHEIATRLAIAATRELALKWFTDLAPVFESLQTSSKYKNPVDQLFAVIRTEGQELQAPVMQVLQAMLKEENDDA